jgi:hypothetical protein
MGEASAGIVRFSSQPLKRAGGGGWGGRFSSQPLKRAGCGGWGRAFFTTAVETYAQWRLEARVFPSLAQKTYAHLGDNCRHDAWTESAPGRGVWS